MKRIVMITETTETVKMGDAGQFKTGIPVDVDDALADALLKRQYPKFKEAAPGDVPVCEALPKVEKKTAK